MANTTDAIHMPPRNEGLKENIPSNRQTKVEDEKDPAAGTHNTPSHGPVMITIINSPGTQVGNKVTNFYGSNPSRRETPIKQTKNMIKLKQSTKPVNIADIICLKRYIAKNYEALFLYLGFDIGEIQQNEIKFRGSVEEIIFRLLLDWVNSIGKQKATVGALANALWSTNLKRPLHMWAEEYEDIHSN